VAVASALALGSDYVTRAKGRYDSRLLSPRSAEDVTGPYDVIVRAEARNVDELGKLVVAKIQAVEGITRTLTCPVVHL
jgi:DNA-binding Lrp family transcriptional regulator